MEQAFIAGKLLGAAAIFLHQLSRKGWACGSQQPLKQLQLFELLLRLTGDRFDADDGWWLPIGIAGTNNLWVRWLLLKRSSKKSLCPSRCFWQTSNFPRRNRPSNGTSLRYSPVNGWLVGASLIIFPCLVEALAVIRILETNWVKMDLEQPAQRSKPGDHAVSSLVAECVIRNWQCYIYDRWTCPVAGPWNLHTEGLSK